MTLAEAWDLVDAGLIEGGWRRWTTADGREFPWHDLDDRREALLEAAEHAAKLRREALAEAAEHAAKLK